MPGFQKNAFRTPFGRNNFLRSTRDFSTESYTVAAASVAAETIDGWSQVILQPGEVMAKITSGGDSGKIGPYDVNATDGRQTLANIVGINNTFLPWQLMERDCEVAVVYDATVVQAWCFERVSGVRGALGNTTAAALVAQKALDITFK